MASFAKKSFILIADNYGQVSNSLDIETIEEAVERASDWAGTHDQTVKIFEAVRLVKPERAPVSVTTL